MKSASRYQFQFDYWYLRKDRAKEVGCSYFSNMAHENVDLNISLTGTQLLCDVFVKKGFQQSLFYEYWFMCLIRPVKMMVLLSDSRIKYTNGCFTWKFSASASEYVTKSTSWKTNKSPHQLMDEGKCDTNTWYKIQYKI